MHSQGWGEGWGSHQFSHHLQAWVTVQWPERSPGFLPEVAQKEPGGQGMGSGVPSGQKDPDGHFPPVAVAGHRQLVLV